MDKYSINKEKYNQVRNKYIKRLVIYFTILMLIALSFLSVCLYIIKMDFIISIISMALTSVITILTICITMKKTMKTNDEIILNTNYEINEDKIIISNKNENIIIFKNDIKRIEHYKNNSIGLVMNKLSRKILYSNCVDNYNDFYEKLNKLYKIQEYKNGAVNILIGILGGILILSVLAVGDMFPHKIFGLLSGVLIYGLVLIFFIFKLHDKLIEKKLKKFCIIGIIAMTFLLLKTILEYILKI
jgi:uncharacterized membrane protein YqjE